MLKRLSHFVPQTRSITLRNADFSRDPVVVTAMDADPLIAGEAQPFATAAAIICADERLKQSFAEIAMPLLLIHGIADRAAKPSGGRQLFEQAGSADKTLILSEGPAQRPRQRGGHGRSYEWD